MNRENSYILWFKEVDLKDVPLVGGKNAPNGFALPSHAYRFFMEGAGLDKRIREILKGLDTHNISDLRSRGRTIREEILKAKMPPELKEVIVGAYAELCKEYGRNTDVAVRSSATAEDLPGSSFAGQQ